MPKKSKKQKKGKKSKPEDFTRCSAETIAQIFGVRKRTVQRWVADGAPQNPDLSKNPAKLLDWLIKREAKKYAAGDSLGAQKTKAEIERISAQVRQMNAGVVPRKYFDKVIESRRRTLRDFLEKATEMNVRHFIGLTMEAARETLQQFAQCSMEAWTGAPGAGKSKSKTGGKANGTD